MLFARPLGIDTSHWNGAINWSQVKAGGYDFAFTKMTEGTTYLDPTATTNLTQAKAAGVYIGGYHFARYDNNSAADEVSWYLSNAGPYISAGYMVPMLDVEHVETMTKAQLSQWVNDWCNGVLAATGVRPVIYTGVSFASNNLDSSVTQWPLWMASWPSNPNPQTGAPSGTAPWSTWNFWQYTDAATVPGVSGGSDADVFNGTLAQLISTYVIGTPPGTPSSPSPTNGASGVNRSGLILNWADASNAVNYDVYLDNMNTAVTTVTASQWTVSPQLTGGTHQWKIVARNAAGTTTGPVWSFSIPSLPSPAVPSSPNFNGMMVNSKPLTLDWADCANATSYDVYLGATGSTAILGLTSSQYGPISPLDGVRYWRVVARNADGATTGPQWQYTMDATPPTATYNGETPATGATTYAFTVTYNDATSGMDASSYGANDVLVTGPNSFSQNATYVSTSGNTVTYRVAAPGGTWNVSDNGAYTISQNAGQVYDLAGNASPAGTIGQFTFTSAFAWKSGTILNVEFDGSSNAIALASAGSDIAATRNGVTLTFSGISTIVVSGSSAADVLQLATALPPTMTFNGNGGEDSLDVQAGTRTFGSDLGATANLAVSVAAGASVTFDATQHLRGLSVAGAATLSAGGAKVLVTKSLAVTGRLDLCDNDLIIDYTGGSPLGSWNGSAYTGITGLVALGRNGGSWDGQGINTSVAGSSGLTGLSVAEASEALSLGSGATTLFSGETVDDTAVLVKYTYIGDVDLDGTLGGDDYFAVDSHFNQSGLVFGYNNGDFNFDGVIDGDDYFSIDSNFNAGSTTPL